MPFSDQRRPDPFLLMLRQNGKRCQSQNGLWTYLRFRKQNMSYDLALFFGYWCAFVTAACCILGMYSRDPFTMLLNIITPCALVALGMIMPCLARRERGMEG